MERLTIILTMGIYATLLGCGQNKSNNTTTDNSMVQLITKPVENITATKDQIDRRAKSEEYCKSKNIPVNKNPNSLFVDTDEKVTIRTQDEVSNLSDHCSLHPGSLSNHPQLLQQPQHKCSS